MAPERAPFSHSTGAQTARGAGWALALLLAINLFNYIDRYILAAVEPLIAAHFFAASDEHAMAKTGSLATAFLVSYMVLAPVCGWLADRYSRWKIIAAGVALWSLASGWSGLAATFSTLVLTRVFVGIGEAAYGPAAPTIIADLYPVERRGRMLSFFYVAIPVGSAIGYGFGGGVAEYVGGPNGWRWPFYLVTIPGILLAALCLLRRDPRESALREGAAAFPLAGESPASTGGSPVLPGAGAMEGTALSVPEGARDPGTDGAVPSRKPKLRFADVAALFRIRSYAFNTAAMTAMTFAMGGIAFWLPRYLYTDRAADFGGTPSLGQINMTFGAITVVAGLLATLLGGWVGDRLRRRFPSAYFLSSGMSMLLAFPFTVGMLYTPFPAAWVLVFCAIFFLFFNTGPANAALANVSPPAIRATAFALNIFIIHALGDAISPPLIGWIAGQTSMTMGFMLVALMMIVASALWLLGARYLGEDTAAQGGGVNGDS